MVGKKLEDMRQEEKRVFLKTAWKNLDMVLLFKKVEWNLRVPKCQCDFCYKVWLDDGKEIYKNQILSYEERVQRENIQREQRKKSRQLKEIFQITNSYFF